MGDPVMKWSMIVLLWAFTTVIVGWGLTALFAFVLLWKSCKEEEKERKTREEKNDG